MALLLDIELAVCGEAAPPGYDTTAEQNISVSEMRQPDSIRTSGPDSTDGHNDTSGWQQNADSLD